jgi:predicted MFS family arabinose efflux permease
MRDYLLPRNERGALSDRLFRSLWIADSVSAIGSQVSALALPTLMVITLHAGVFAVALVGVAQYGALVATVLVAGVAADRRNPRAILLAADLLRALAVGSIVVTAFADCVSAGQLIAVAVVVGAGQAFFDTTYWSLVSRFLTGGTRLGANSLMVQSQYLARSIGPALAGVLLHVLGNGKAVSVDAATFVVSALCVLLIGKTWRRMPGALTYTDAPLGSKTTSGLRLVWSMPHLRWTALAAGTGNLGNQIVQGIYLVFVYRTLSVSVTLVGVAWGLGGVTGILGARLATRAMARLGIGPSLLLSTVLAGASWLVVLIPGAPSFLAVAVAANVISLAVPLFSVVEATLRQNVAPLNVQGLAIGGMSVISLITIPAGMLAGGVIATLSEVRTAILVGAIVAMASGLWCLPLLSADLGSGPSPASEELT